MGNTTANTLEVTGREQAEPCSSPAHLRNGAPAHLDGHRLKLGVSRQVQLVVPKELEEDKD